MNEIQLFLQLGEERMERLYFTASGKMATVPRQGESVTIIGGEQKVEKVNHCLQLRHTEIRLAPSSYSNLIQRYLMLKKMGWCDFSFNGPPPAIQEFLKDAENNDR